MVGKIGNAVSNLTTKVQNFADDIRDASSSNPKHAKLMDANYNRKGRSSLQRGFGFHPMNKLSVANGFDRSRSQKFLDLMSGAANTTGAFAKSAVTTPLYKMADLATNIRDASSHAQTEETGQRSTSRTGLKDNLVDTLSGVKNSAQNSSGLLSEAKSQYNIEPEAMFGDITDETIQNSTDGQVATPKELQKNHALSLL